MKILSSKNSTNKFKIFQSKDFCQAKMPNKVSKMKISKNFANKVYFELF